MVDERAIGRMEELLVKVTRLGGQNEITSIVSNLTVVDAAPAGLTNFITIADERDGDTILAKTVPGIIYAVSDKVNVLFVEGTEPIAFQQGSESPSAGLWGIVPSTSTDIFYNGGDVGIGKSVAPDSRLEILDTAQAQLRLTHTEDTKFVDFTLDTNHDLTITPSSTGQVIFQPTTDSTDFFQVLDADGGTPVLNVDSTNERVGIGTVAPAAVLDVAGSGTMTILGDGTGQTFVAIDGAAAFSRGFNLQTAAVNRWIFRANSTAEAGSNVGSDFEISRRSDAGALLGTAMFIKRDNGKVGINQGVPSAMLHINQNDGTLANPVIYLRQADVSEEFITFQGFAAAATLTQSIVAEADVTTATRQGFVKVFVTDEGNQITDQSYFIPLFTLA